MLKSLNTFAPVQKFSIAKVKIAFKSCNSSINKAESSNVIFKRRQTGKSTTFQLPV